MKITAYPVSSTPLEIRSASPKRNWMDASNIKNAYRCLPLSIANSYGWEILSSSKFKVEWNGGKLPSDVKITNISGNMFPDPLFGEATFTFHTGFMFKTEYPYGLYVTGAPNFTKPNVIPLSGIVETHWLPFTFTMNWIFTQPGEVEFDIGDPICHIFPVDLTLFDYVEPEIRSLNDDVNFEKEYWDWNLHRRNFIVDKNAGKIPGDGWQKSYFQGGHPPDNQRKCPFHITDAGDTKSTHKTKINVPEFVNKETNQFKLPQYYTDAMNKLNN